MLTGYTYLLPRFLGPQALLHELDKIQGEARAATARAEAADAEVQAREQLLAAARVRMGGS